MVGESLSRGEVVDSKNLEPQETNEVGGPPLRRGSPRPRSSARVVRLKRWLWGCLVGLLVLLGTAAVLFRQMDGNQQRLSRQLMDLRDSLQVRLDTIQQLQDERRQLVEGRIPGLQALECDRALEVPDRYVRNVIFTLTGLDTRVYEYRAVLENPGNVTVKLRVMILFFDALGVQIGSAEVSWDRSADLLGAGEVRAWSGSADLLAGRQPEFFMVVSEALQ